jgi:phospholipid-translocating ATPase
LKHKLSESPVLKVPDFNKPFVVQTDASDVGIRAILSQTDEKGHEHPIAFASRKLKPREQKYAVIEKECLAIIWALGFFYPYLYGQHFVIETDHQPLKWLHQMKNKNQRLTRWALSLRPSSFSPSSMTSAIGPELNTKMLTDCRKDRQTQPWRFKGGRNVTKRSHRAEHMHACTPCTCLRRPLKTE